MSDGISYVGKTKARTRNKDSWGERYSSKDQRKLH